MLPLIEPVGDSGSPRRSSAAGGAQVLLRQGMAVATAVIEVVSDTHGCNMGGSAPWGGQ